MTIIVTITFTKKSIKLKKLSIMEIIIVINLHNYNNKFKYNTLF